MISRLFLSAVNSVVNFITIIALLLVGSYAIYSLWDNNQILMEAENVQEDMIKLKPTVVLDSSEEVDNSDSFAELQKINSDVCAWITMDNTKIDFPILQGENNLTYINTDVYGNFSLAGSIYLDSRNQFDFSDNYSLLYGHHMADSRMFGDLDLYKGSEFFRKNNSGLLILPQKVFNLKVIACLVVASNDVWFFDPPSIQHDIQGLLDYTEQNALQLNPDMLQLARDTENVQLIALSTCSSEFPDARTIVLAVMDPFTAGGLGGQKNE